MGSLCPLLESWDRCDVAVLSQGTLPTECMQGNALNLSLQGRTITLKLFLVAANLEPLCA